MMIGETKLGYKITELVGQGGFGTVYKAVKKNKALETVRALKHISLPSRKEWTDVYNSMGNDMARTDAYFDTILQEILNEIRILADLTNKGIKNVVWYYENEIEDTPSPKHYDIYLLMEFLTPFTSYIETHEIKVKDVIRVGIDILSALVECHKRKIIHRDIKTDNIFISEDGDFKLGDFGVSKKLSDRSRATSMKGTPNYIAPEVYLGQEYDKTVDLYSLGIVLYRLLNYNRNPFMPDYPASYNSEDEDIAFEMRMKGDVPNYPKFAKGELGDVILKSISNKDDRYKDASEFKTALENVLNSMSKEELEVVVLENQLSGVDFSTFGSRNEMTQMANDNQSNVSNNSFQNTQMNMQGTYGTSGNAKKSAAPKILAILAIILFIGVVGVGAYFMLNSLNSKKEIGEKFVQVDGFTKFMKKNGEYAQNEWIFFDNNEYYFNGRQSLVTDDLVEFNGKTYYVDDNGAKIINNWHKDAKGKEYYLNENGEPFKDTAKTINGEVFFFNQKGEKVIDNWVTYDGYDYYIDGNGKMLTNRFKEYGPDWYYLGGDGKTLKNTFCDDNGQTYYFDENGKMKKDTLFDVNPYIYYAQSDGAVKKGGWCANNQYYADEEGKILINTVTPDGVIVGSDGRRVPKPMPETRQPETRQPETRQPETTIRQETTKRNPSIPQSGDILWGDHARYNEKVYLDEYGEEGVGEIKINITKLKDDGTQEVADVNKALQEIYEEANDRAQYELPYKYFELEKTTQSTNNENTLVIVVTGEIKYIDNERESMRYKLTLNKADGNVIYEKVR